MAIEVSFCQTKEEFIQAYGAIGHYFGSGISLEEVDQVLEVFECDRTQMAIENGVVVGGCGAHTYEMTTPGGKVSAAGITIVGVRPTHRRRGILRSLMRAQIDDVRARQEPVAYLWASEETIYGRFGYGMAALSAAIELPKSDCVFARPFTPRGELRLHPLEEAYAPISEVYDRLRGDYPGMFSRKEGWWKHRRLADTPSRRGSSGELNRVVLYLDGRPEAYCLYRLNQALDGGITSGVVNVLEALGTTPEATRELWHFLLQIDWIAKVRAGNLSVDHPLLFLLAHPRRLRPVIGDSLWVRLVDVEAALNARRFADAPPIVLEVEDPFCPWNAGRYRVSPEGASRTEAGADLRLDVEALGSLYLGGFSASQLARACRIEERSAGALGRADLLFRGERAPWCPEVF